MSSPPVRLAGVVLFGHPDDRFDHIWEAAATAATLLQRVIDLRRHDQVPGVLVEELRRSSASISFSVMTLQWQISMGHSNAPLGAAHHSARR